MTSPLLHGLPPIIDDRARMLILGNMPSVLSLATQQYYGNPRNAFWRIMGEIFCFDAEAPYQERTATLRSNGVAVWDVLGSCRRVGSLDSAVEPDSMVPNDFRALLDAHPAIERVMFNGAAAEKNFNRLVGSDLPSVRLPSTSPAQTMRYADKLAAWRGAVNAGSLRNSAGEQDLLRAAAVWAADCAEQALCVFERRHPADMRLREAIHGGREFGRGKKRDKTLRTLAWAAHSASKDADEPSAKYAARAAMLTAAVAYTHTDLNTGLPGVRQARHILGPAVYAAMALGDEAIRDAARSATPDIRRLITCMPSQPAGTSRLSNLYAALDSALRDTAQR
jgi:hypoxanthine-DNA glycosylase